jgi:hypothetical protein
VPIVVTFDAPVRDLSRALTDFQRRQVPFATVLAIKFTLEDAQTKLRRELGDTFKLRNKFLAQGIRTQFAKKQTLVGNVHTVDDILATQITGGIKGGIRRPVQLPRAVRGRGRGDDRGAAEKIFRKAKRPTKLKTKKRHFTQTLRDGDEALFRRLGKSRYPIEIMWRTRTKPIRVKPGFDFSAIARRVFSKRWDKNWGRGLARALSSSK